MYRKTTAICVAAAVLGMASSPTEAQTSTTPAGTSRPSGPVQQKLVPGMAGYTDDVLFGEVWPGTGLSPRDRSLVVISALISTNKPAQLKGHLGRALTNGVTPVEASGVLTHLAFYSGWPNAVIALDVYDEVFTARDVDLAAFQAATAPLKPGTTPMQPLPPEFTAIAPRFVDLNSRVVQDDLWRRSDLSPRDRSLVTITALTAMGDTDILGPYLQRGVAAGLTRDEIVEAVTHLGFYVGWGKATKAISEVSRTLGPGSS